MNSTWKAALGVILIFILGWFGGALSVWIFAHHSMMVMATGNTQAITMLLERQTTRGLKLDDSQKMQVHELLLTNVKERKELQKSSQPQVLAYNRQTMQAIDAVLTPEQQQKFQDNLLLFKARFGRNPLNTGADENAAAPTPQTASTNTSTSVESPQVQ